MLHGALAVCLSLIAPGDPAADLPVHPRRLLVKPRVEVSAEQVASAHALAGARVLRDLPQIGWQVIEVKAGERARTRELYAQLDVFAEVELDRARRIAHVPNDPMWPGMWHMRQIEADHAWDTHRGAPGTRVAVMDTGIDVNHQDLAANIWTNPGEIPGNGVDDDGNGYIDDVHGYDFAYDDPNPDDQHGHGTSCAGIVAAVQDNNIGVTGVAPQCQVVAVKAALDTGYFYDSATVPALIYCADMGFQVISMSFYSDGVTPPEKDAIDYCHALNVLPVASAGNANQVLPYYPAAYEHTLSVAATTQSDSKASFSNYGSWVDVAAPGVSVSTTRPNNGYTTTFAGTSASAPHVAGLAGLLFAAKPGATNDEVRAAIEDTGVPLVEYPYGEYTNYGLVDCYAALQRILGNTSGSKPPRFLFAAPVAGAYAPGLAPFAQGPRPLVSLYGVGLELPNVVRVLRSGTPVALLSQARNQLEYEASSPISSLVELEVGGQVVDSYSEDRERAFVYTPSDACTQGSGSPVVEGGFHELQRVDGSLASCTRRSDGTISMNAIVRKVLIAPISSMELEFTRSYLSTNGTESIRLYDWSSASYPYGNWVTIASQSISGSGTQTIAAVVANPTDFIDPEGTIYVEIYATGASSGGRLLADSFQLQIE